MSVQSPITTPVVPLPGASFPIQLVTVDPAVGSIADFIPK